MEETTMYQSTNSKWEEYAPLVQWLAYIFPVDVIRVRVPGGALRKSDETSLIFLCNSLTSRK